MYTISWNQLEFSLLTATGNLADALNGFMAIPNQIAILALSPVIVRLVREHLNEKDGKLAD